VESAAVDEGQRRLQVNNNAYAGTLLPAFYGPLASYYVKFIKAYQAQGIPIDAITPQNEPRSNSS